MITWTRAGAVARPRTVQVRVQRAYPGRVRAGAPVPARSMSTAEILDNLRWFTRGLSGPRSRPCEALVLSGVGVAGRPDIPEAIDAARGWGIRRVVLHIGPEDLDDLPVPELAGRVDQAVVPVQPGRAGSSLVAGGRAIRACREAGIEVIANTVLSALAVPELEPAARGIAAAAPSGVSFTYPFPIAGNTSSEVPGIGAVRLALARAVALLEGAGVRVALKGLPGCYLPALARLLRRSSNRFYVDADHQRADALLFFPDVVSFAKVESCRFCALDRRCDGFFSTYLRRSSFPPLTPVGPDGAQGS